MSFRKDFECAAKACGVDTLALHPDDMKTEGRYYYDESTEKAHSIAAELSLKLEARIEQLEEMLQWYVDEDEIHESDPENQYWTDGKHRAIKLLENK